MRKILQQLHLVLGGMLALPLIVLGLTGTILTLAENGESGLPAMQHAPAHTVGEIVAAAMRGAPDHARPLRYVAGRRDMPARVTLSVPDAAMLNLLVDPRTLYVQPAPPRGGGFIAQIHALHETFLAGRTGRLVVGWMGWAMIVLCVTGPILWWPGSKRIAEGFFVKRDAGPFRTYRDVHRAVGIVTVMFLFIVSVTGTYIVFPDSIARPITTMLPGRALWANGTVPRTPRHAKTVNIDDAIGMARAATGAQDVVSVQFASGTSALRVDVRAARASSESPVTVLIDPVSGSLVDIRDPANYSLGERLVAAMRPLHEGQIAGPVWKAVLAIVGLLPLFFAVTGLSMWRIRTRAGRGRRAVV